MTEDAESFTSNDFNDYVDEMIGDYTVELKKKTFNDRRKTSYSEAIRYNADIIWNAYTKQDDDPTLALVNMDVLDVILLCLHPKNLLKKKDISNATKRALSEILKLQDLILLKDYTEMGTTWVWLDGFKCNVRLHLVFFIRKCKFGLSLRVS